MDAYRIDRFGSVDGIVLCSSDAAQSATDASTRFFRLSILTAVGVLIAAFGILYALVVGLHQYFDQIQTNVQNTLSLAASITANADQAKSDAASAITDKQALRRDLGMARAQIEDLSGQLGNVMREVERLRSTLPAPRPSRR
jgi:hypothetical protein